ncbi:Cyclic di-GMP phosphodiesterase PdeR [Zhongshania aliphaticivorans]|uniref:diguanylate cyclase n=1 Tax=Zhongshania aliphaticivorans TaxID=1470434 RepID=A0A5S9P6Q0_9GAMM|nr:GGDEF domain-containing protein [Zhongshania aliphaticivorans]CAA0091736.1 Cyclic di-GMP phosphodiesterase PdeR [Zhongshania aliphaticivorans]CAA0099083.1 Cyclic di-GMP phosphodiesterase PdeR [Zhongshania aliphaticivorans]
MKKENSLSFSDWQGLHHKVPALKSAGRYRYGRVYGAMALGCVLFALAASITGELKAWSDIDWLDVAGEGMVVVAVLSWLHFLLQWRPPGPVTQCLLAGFGSLGFGFYLDVLDEFIRLGGSGWGASLESVVTPLAVLLITYAVIALSQEQRVFARQQLRREAGVRDHRDIDPVTDLYSGSYCRHALADALSETKAVSLWLIDLDNFSAVNRLHGFACGDAVLNRVAATLVAAVPEEALVCRYGGDRFVVIAGPTERPGLQGALGRLLSEAIQLALYHRTGDSFEIAVRLAVVESSPGEDAAGLLARANAEILATKRRDNEH